ncbi:MAG TPA: PH domain-containing protein, partial [Terrimesophilobacter sp.]|nr:PH domain-containing protein [Terrimesophilobacter sp.]
QVSQAGSDANVELSYLSGSNADALRRDILLLASGTRLQAPDQADAGGGLIERRLSELLAPELDPTLAPPESVVKIPTGRLAGSIALSEMVIIAFLALIGGFVAALVFGDILVIFGVIFPVVGIVGYQVNRFLKSLRYTIASTPDGVRIGHGLLSTVNDTLPPGRIHSVQIDQSILWRPAGWWQIKVNRASRSSSDAASGQQSSTVLPVGTLDDVRRVLGLILPDIGDLEPLLAGLVSKGDDDGWTNSPPRARIVRWFSRRRNGFRMHPGGIALRHGQIWRDLVIVPEPRVQSVALHQGPLGKLLKLSRVYVHTVPGPIVPALGALDPDDARRFFGEVAATAVEAGRRDRSHRWRAEPA